MQRVPACACGGHCPRCRGAVRSGDRTISDPFDRHEQEAEHLADRILRMPPPAVSAAEHQSPATRRAYRRVEHGAATRVIVPPVVDGVLQQPGRPLDAATRALFEPRLGYDLGEVRVHTGEAAAASARAVDALAYTVGADVVFGEGEYAPDTVAGRRLIVHELVHVVQQGVAPATPGARGKGAGADPEASRAFTGRMNGTSPGRSLQTAPVPVIDRTVPGLQRRPMFNMRSSVPDYCDAREQCLTLEAWLIAEQMVTNAVSVADGLISAAAKAAALTAAGDDKGLRAHERDVRRATASVLEYFPGFTPAELQTLRDNLAAIGQDMAGDVTVHCPASASVCKVTHDTEGNVVSYTGANTQCAGGADINVCRDSLTETDDAATTLIHESAHHVVCGIQPPILRPIPGTPNQFSHETDIYAHEEEFATLTAAQALQNPDSYAMFCAEVYSGPKRGFDCHTHSAMDSKAWQAYRAKLAPHQIP